MGDQLSWKAFYPEAAKNFDESSIEVKHMAEVVIAAARPPAVDSPFGVDGAAVSPSGCHHHPDGALLGAPLFAVTCLAAFA